MSNADHASQHSRTIAERLQLLVDKRTIETGDEPTYGDIAQALAEQGISLSRARWSYMLNGHRDVNDARLLTALAEYFGVDPVFLTDDGPMPDGITAQLDLIRSMREAKVSAFAARTLGTLSPNVLNAITAALDADRDLPDKE